MKKWETIYSQAIDDLKNFKRPQIKLNREEFMELYQIWQEKIQELDNPSQNEEALKALEKILTSMAGTWEMFLRMINRQQVQKKAHIAGTILLVTSPMRLMPPIMTTATSAATTTPNNQA